MKKLQQIHWIKFFLLISLMYSGINLTFAQLIVQPLGSNTKEQAATSQNISSGASRDFPDTLELPFFEDFSSMWIKPDPAKWLNNSVFINTDYPVKPPSWGVATFDGLNRDGFPYRATISHGSADTLTSLPINLDYPPSDSIYLSFYYQPKGLGNYPEYVDTFQVEFKNPNDSVWTYAWSVPGEDFPQTNIDFKRAMIPITDTAFLKNGFQFRFRNYAQLNGSWDHWHLDYVRLDRLRNRNDTAYQDVAYMYRGGSLLKEYTSVPLSHFLINADDNMGLNYTLSLTNNATGSTNKLYKYYFENDLGEIRDSISSAPQGPIVYRQEFTFSSVIKYTFEDQGNDCAIYQLKHFLLDNSDNIVTNDTAYYEQILCNYYALDDGTAEERIGLENQGGGFVAQRFETLKSDTLKAVQFYFNKVDSVSQGPFFLMIWSAGSNVPGQNIYTQGLLYPQYDGVNKFYTYELDEPQFLNAGTYYFGWAQTGNFNLNLGFDRNLNNNDRIFYNQTGAWNNYTAQAGTLMIRPMFGTSETLYTAIEKTENSETNKALIYPNPADQYFTINNLQTEYTTVEYYDLTGKFILNNKLNKGINILNTSNLSNGIYLLKLNNDKLNKQEFKRLLIQH
jgi:hypothetical protein